MVTAASERKRSVRNAVRERRAASSAAQRASDAAALGARLIELVERTGATRVSCYLPTATEPDPRAFLSWALAHGVEVLLPISLPDQALAWALHSAVPPIPGRHGILEPAGERLPVTAASTADLLLIPACAVDETGTRLGWGLGYFDRALAALDPLPPVYAVVFEADVFAELPRDPHDVPVTGTVTPASIRRFSA
ncbi:5-formyltetrahydrofolate cyclo-ligase [Leucobacter luti]|uniref:5-formyltetrahydrofolate cyclo-ligase n=1 Tax=Leucobacter luti TaxID=340320 RepID=A0A4R6S9L6_9MICO|nr:5-formyltetrahydrofolate cyclo-ligase [Leucobacter luti]TDP95626.1 5-formyltetrahydrofolate cyclo-ligase [Leucobacter luti]